MTSPSVAIDIARWVVDRGLGGFGPLSGAEELADEYLNDSSYVDHHARVDSLIRWELSKSFTTGFMTGIGGLVTLPVSMPAALGASWLIQARMVGAIARIYGHDLRQDRIRTLVLVALAGDAAKEVLKEAGVRFGTRLSNRLITQLPGTLLLEINRAIGFRLLTKAGQTGVVNATKVVPVVGGLVSGAFDASSCRLTGLAAKRIFVRNSGTDK